MNTWIHIALFLIVLFLYIHIANQLKRSEDLEIYEMDYTDNAHLQEVCDIKQPILFEYKSHNTEFFQDLDMEKLLESGSQDIKIKDIEDYYKENIDTVDYVVLPFQSAQTLTITDTNAKYFAENNDHFIEDAGLVSQFTTNDSFLKPAFTAQTKYDVCIGSKNAITPLRYHTYFRHFISVTSGKIRIKMTPWKSNKYLYPIIDYDNYEFFSPVNVWKPQKKYAHEMDKIKFLEFDVNAGYVLYIPPYWWYSIKYLEEPDTVVTSFTYNSIMNCIANLPKWVLYYLQQSNIKKRVTKTLDISLYPSTTDSIIDEKKSI
jgi:hypothetical protein